MHRAAFEEALDVLECEVVEAILQANPMIEVFYCRGGGSHSDLRTDMKSAIAYAHAFRIPLPRGPHD